MKCVICGNEIEKKYTPTGKMYWDKGNNALPVQQGRCCDYCNSHIVIPARLKNYQLTVTN